MPTRHAAPPDFPRQLSVEQARELALALARERRLSAEQVATDDALGRYLATDLVAPRDQPPFANSAMDGFALRGNELPAAGERSFRLAGTVLAGAGAPPGCQAGECLRITTGAPLPSGTDTVVIKENVRIEGDLVIIRAGERAGANVRPAGEDWRQGEALLQSGEVLTPARLAVLAACGAASVLAARRPRVALFVTGDELVPPGQALGPGQIHDSNRYSLGGLLRSLGIAPVRVAHLRDDPDILRTALREAGSDCDVILSSGGVSAGEADFLPGLIAELGRVHFWKVRMKPGMPVLCGDIGQALVFALPGNPVSTIATFLALVAPTLRALQGARDPLPVRRARLAVPVAKKHDRSEFPRVTLELREDGTCWATPLAQQGSGMLRGAALADALAIIPESARELAAGTLVDVLPANHS
ncbi:gephyrin-like molybdotransferase Glp [Dokdonella sp.]|uniref:molybdopterin molybdotransferase MoeA n=1 Tax=Dokdonella sp. TaxID=2291710 RepID=UPI0031C995F2|nr:molybdopterin molybdotransferase MoeA [Dokdonella sp.]